MLVDGSPLVGRQLIVHVIAKELDELLTINGAA
jgi:hypothetical protein